MALYLTNSVFIHVPKTGGTWAGKALSAAGVAYQGYTGLHDSPEIGDRYAFAFVRHPASWIVSWFNHRERKQDWRSDRRIDIHCKAPQFDEFIDNVIRHPGIMDQMFLDFVGPYTGMPNFHVGHQESLVDDLVRFLTDAGERFDEVALRALPMTHVAPQRRAMSTEQLDAFYASQRDCFERWGYQKNPPLPPPRDLLVDQGWLRLLGVEPMDMAAETGLHSTESYENGRLRWTDGDAILRLSPEAAVTCDRLHLELWPVHPPGRSFSVQVNGSQVLNEVIGENGGWAGTADFAPCALHEIAIRSESGTPPGDNRRLGVALKRCHLQQRKE